jgi:hypothetical protein
MLIPTMSTTATTDLGALLDQLDSRTIIDRLAALEREQRALRVLLRAARARERTLARQPVPTTKGGRDA